MKFVSIQQKLVFSTMIIITGIFAGVLAVIALLNLQTTNENLRKTEISIRNALAAKGKTLVANNSVAMQGMVADNAFTDMQNLVATTVKDDEDIVYGIFMDSQAKPWAMATPENPNGKVTDWTPLTGTTSQWAGSRQAPASQSMLVDGEEIIEFVAPVVIDDETMGHIRYGLATRGMHSAIGQAKETARHFRNRMLKFLGSLAAVALLLGLLAARRQAMTITRPILSLSGAAEAISKGDYNQVVPSETRDEIGTLASTFEVMRQTIKMHTDHLNDLVEEKMQQVRDIMNNIDQGLLTINLDGSVNPEYSARANRILQVEDVANHSVAELLRMDRSGLEHFKAWLSLVVARHRSQRWHKLERLAPIRELELQRSEEDEYQYVRLSYQKILDKESHDLKKIMILALDVTDSRRIERRMEEERVRHENEVKIILAIANNPSEVIADFIRDTMIRIDTMNEVTENLRQMVYLQREQHPEGRPLLIEPEQILVLYRDLHTIKGNAGTYGFDLLTNLAHVAENLLEDLRHPPKLRRTDTLEALLSHVDAMQDEIHRIVDMAQRLGGSQEERTVRIPVSKVDHVLTLCDTLSREQLPKTALRLIQACKQLPFMPLGLLCRKYGQVVTRTADRVGKQVVFSVENTAEEVPPDTLSRIDEALVHILRNAVDHGIEPPGERKRLGKGPGRIAMAFESTETTLTFRVEDDGQGIDADKLTARAVEAGLLEVQAAGDLTREERLQLMFLPGVTTTTTVDITSGRGVGLEAALKNVRDQGGEIEVSSLQGKGTTFHITLPRIEPAPSRKRNPE